MNEQHLHLTYHHSDQLQYKKIPFQVGTDIERIEVSYSYLRHTVQKTEGAEINNEVNIIDLGLFDEQDRLVGWSGSERLEIHVSEQDSTPGYRNLVIHSGVWSLALGVYKVTESVEVEVTIRQIPKQRRWLKGDLHMHTLNSDGRYTTSEVIAYARHAGLDYIALTDHNNTEQNKEIGNPETISVLPGMEYTNYRGHANFYFLDDGIFTADPLSNTVEQMQQTVREAKKRGAIVSLNHICDDGCPWLFGFDIPYDLVEVWNGPFKMADMRAIVWWQQQLESGRRLAVVGGSDCHRIEVGRSFGTPTTYVHALSSGRRDILTALVEGRSFITATPDGARLDLSIGTAGLGECIQYEEDLEGKAAVRNAKSGDRLVLVSDQGVEQQWLIEQRGSFTFPFKVTKRLFYRLELYRTTYKEELATALTNPVYLES